MKIKQNITFFIALFFLGLFFSKAQSADSLAFRQAQDSTDINVFVRGNINNNTYWKQQVLSNQGGAVLDLSLFEQDQPNNFKTNGYNSYIPLSKSFDYSRIYKFTKIEYRPTLNEGQFISALHTQSFKNFSFGVYYQKLVSEGEFSLEKKDHSNVELRFNYTPQNKKYHSFITVSHNVSQVFENGGFQRDSIYTSDVSISNSGIPINLTEAQNELKNTKLSWENDLYLVKTDSFNIKLQSNSSYLSKSEHYTDTDPSYISTELGIIDPTPYYPNYYISTTETNDSIEFHSFNQNFSVNINNNQFLIAPYIELEKGCYNLGYGNSDISLYKVGLKYKVLKGRLSGQVIYKNQNDIKSGIDLNSTFNLHKNLSFKFRYNEEAPELFFRKYESNHFRWDNDFTRSKTLDLKAELQTFNKTTKVNLIYKNIQDHIFLNEDALPLQSDNNQIYGGLEVNTFIKKGRFSLNSQFLFQKVGEENINTESKVINIPTFIGRLKIAYKQKMLGEALVQPGIQINYNSKYFASKYMAPLSSFHIQNEQKLGGAVLLDVFVNVKISSFTIYAMYNNLLETLFKEDNFASPNYVGPVQQFNFGLRWNFYDK